MPLEKLGPYRVEKLLGRGGMGAVYAGVNEQTGERAALKVLAAHLSDNIDFRERFMAEVETLKKLKHPNIVQLFAYGQEDEHLFYVMQLVDGSSLQDELQAGRRFQWREVAKIGVEICRALKHAHDSGVIHRDLKPANLLLDSHNQVKLTDFGIAKLYGGTQITAAGGILGTADYMPPEQAEGKPVTVRSDLYSLGSVLYALLTGRPPFAAKSLAEVIHGLRFDKPIAVRRLAPDTPEPFEAIILQLLEKDPANRIASAFAVGNYLRAMEHGLSLETQVGQFSVNDLPLEAPAQQHTSAAVNDVTMVPSVATPPPVEISAVTQMRSVTARLDENPEIPRVPLRDLATQPPGAPQAIRAIATAPAAESLQPKSTFVTVAEEEQQRRQREGREEQGPPLWLLISGMVAVIALLGALVAYAILPPSADSLYGTISVAAATGDVSQLQNVEAEINQFIARFPADPRGEELQQYLESLETNKLERRFTLKARLGGNEGLAPVEREYLAAFRLMEAEPETALRRFQALVDVFEPGDETLAEKAGEGKTIENEPEDDDHRRAQKMCVELAKKQIEKLSESTQRQSREELEVIRSRLAVAENLQPKSPEKAERIYRGIIALYGDKPWARDLVRRAQRSLRANP